MWCEVLGSLFKVCSSCLADCCVAELLCAACKHVHVIFIVLVIIHAVSTTFMFTLKFPEVEWFQKQKMLFRFNRWLPVAFFCFFCVCTQQQVRFSDLSGALMVPDNDQLFILDKALDIKYSLQVTNYGCVSYSTGTNITFNGPETKTKTASDHHWEKRSLNPFCVITHG